MPTAILVDGDFFLKRYQRIYGREKPEQVAQTLHKLCLEHLKQKEGNRKLYRIFFYDCPPIMKKAHSPLTGKAIDFSKSDVALFRVSLHKELRKLRKVALRLGYLNEKQAFWSIKSDKTKALLEKRIVVDELNEQDLKYEVRQNGVDMSAYFGPL